MNESELSEFFESEEFVVFLELFLAALQAENAKQ